MPVVATTAAPDVARRPSRFQRWVQRIVAQPSVTRRVARLAHGIDRRLLEWSGDRLCLTTTLIGLPVTRVTTIGARTGLRRTLPLTALPDGDRLALIASNFGRGHAPGWLYNLRAHPQAETHHGARRRRWSAREATAEEHARLWRHAVELYPGYADYAARAAPRAVPIILLTPEDG